MRLTSFLSTDSIGGRAPTRATVACRAYVQRVVVGLGCCMALAASPVSVPRASAAAPQAIAPSASAPQQIAAATTNASTLTFEQHIRPILKAHCFQCHGEEEELQGNLDLRLVRLIRHGGESGPALVAGDLAGSRLWQRIEQEEMPPGPKKLSSVEKQQVRDWIMAGAPTRRAEPENPLDARYTPEELEFWSFQPIQPVVPPHPRGYELATPVDGFIAQQLQERQLPFSPPASASTLLRRVTLDLWGLPPDPAWVAAWENDHAPDAWEQLIDYLLASPEYGVRWGRHWLDVAGYAESDGNPMADVPRPHAWHYRDYVVASWNGDKPFDVFLQEQLAGDELLNELSEPTAAERKELLAATGFLRMPPDITETDNSINDRNQVVADVVKVIGTAVLGLSVGCAQCHDHRYEPISADDYYQLRAVFDPAWPLQTWRKPSERLVDLTDQATRSEMDRIEASALALQQEIEARRRAHCQQIQEQILGESPSELQEALRGAVRVPAAELTDEQKKLLDRFPRVKSVDWIIGQLIEYDMPAYRRFEAELAKVAELRESKPPMTLVMAVQEPPGTPPASHLLFRGDPAQPRRVVEPAELYVLARHRQPSLADNTALLSAHGSLSPQSVDIQRPSSGRRLAYARQLTDGHHPTVARVIVNRVWMHHFGRGLVATPGDFGMAGERPSHPQLLDWLALDFMQHGWSLKHLHRQILCSTTYRQASTRSAHLEQVDPDNRWWGRMQVRRMEAEVARDCLLAVSQKIHWQQGGPSVPVDLDGAGKVVLGKRTLRDGLFSNIESATAQAARRSLFVANRRSMPLNVLETFDLPAMNPNCVTRVTTTSAPQALWCLNDEFIIECADQLAELACQPEHVGQEPRDLQQQVEFVCRRILGSLPTPTSLQRCRDFVAEQRALFAADSDETWQKKRLQDPRAVDVRACSSLCQMLMASNAFWYID